MLLDHPEMFGYCYTQLTDVYQEENGLYWFDRRPKFDLERIRRAQQRPAAIEQIQPAAFMSVTNSQEMRTDLQGGSVQDC